MLSAVLSGQSRSTAEETSEVQNVAESMGNLCALSENHQFEA
jgi:hypothetical protein